MQKRKRKARLIGVDKESNDYKLIPKQSLGIFRFGNAINKYLNLPHDFTPSYLNLDFDTYDFFKPEVSVWTINNKIDTIQCTVKCYWQGVNLIGMLYEDFLTLAQQKPDEEEKLCVDWTESRCQHQMVYTFDALGLMLWVWRKKIRTVLVSTYEDEDESVPVSESPKGNS